MAIEPTLEPTLEDLRNPGGGAANNTTALDRSEESSTTLLYRAAIGALGKDFYLPIFNRFEAADRGGISWNWAASLTTLNWLAFRKLWSAALAYAGIGVGLALLVFGIGRLVFRFSEPVEMALLVAYLAVMFVVPGLFANALLHADCRKRMARALAANTTLPEACTMLARQAPSRNRLIALVVANALLLGGAIGAYMNFPAAGSLPKDTMRSLDAMDPLGTRVAAPAASVASAPASAPAPVVSAPAIAASAPISAPTSAPAPASTSAPATAASAPLSSASAAKPAVATASAPKPASSAPKPATSAPTSATPAAASSPPVKAASAASRVAVGVVQVEPTRKASTPARTASAAQPAASSPQDVGKVYRSEPAPAAAPTAAPASKPLAAIAAKPVTPPAAAKPKAASSAAKADGKYLINVGLFAQEANAGNAMAKLKEANLPAYTEEIRSPTKGKLTRVRVGPFANQADADAAVVKIKAVGLDAQIARQ